MKSDPRQKHDDECLSRRKRDTRLRLVCTCDLTDAQVRGFHVFTSQFLNERPEMTKLDVVWWQKAAGLSRRELLDELVLATEAVADAEDALVAFQKSEKLRESVVVAFNLAEMDLSLSRLGRTRSGVRTVLTNSYGAETKLRGSKLENKHVLMVPGWARGKYADEIKEFLAISGVNWKNCRYAPSPETDRAEGLSNWGRTEAAVVDDMLYTVNNLLARTLERTSEKP